MPWLFCSRVLFTYVFGNFVLVYINKYPILYVINIELNKILNSSTALCIATREAIRSMRENNVDGVIINVNSIFGHNVASKFPLCVYGASKFAVTALSKILKNELNNIQSKIKVTVSIFF